MSITLCAIVKDEGARLGTTLARFRRYVSRMVVVDTGSVDDTAAVGRRAGAEVYHRQFVDFADARNFSLNLVPSGWVLVIDADEWIANPETLHALVTRDDVAAYRFPRYDYVGTGWGLSFPCRLFRRDAAIYNDPVFEEPMIDRARGTVARAWNVAIHHVGFLQPDVKLLRKRALYGALLHRCLASDERPWVREALALLSADAGDFNAALSWMAAAYPAVDHVPIEAGINQARLWMAVGEERQALEWSERALARTSLSAYQLGRIHNVRGLALARLGRMEKSAAAFEAATRAGCPVASYFLNLALALYGVRRTSRALDAIAAGVRINPDPHAWGPVSARARFDYQDGWLHRLDTANDLEAWNAVRNAAQDAASMLDAPDVDSNRLTSRVDAFRAHPRGDVAAGERVGAHSSDVTGDAADVH